jgi:hypothetical protein
VVAKLVQIVETYLGFTQKTRKNQVLVLASPLAKR